MASRFGGYIGAERALPLSQEPVWPCTHTLPGPATWGYGQLWPSLAPLAGVGLVWLTGAARPGSGSRHGAGQFLMGRMGLQP